MCPEAIKANDGSPEAEEGTLLPRTGIKGSCELACELACVGTGTEEQSFVGAASALYCQAHHRSLLVEPLLCSPVLARKKALGCTRRSETCSQRGLNFTRP